MCSSDLPIDVTMSRPDIAYQVNATGQFVNAPIVNNGTVLTTPVINNPYGGAFRNNRRPDVVAGVEAIVAACSFLDAALLRGIERLEATDAVRGLGWASVKDFLTHLTGGHRGTGGGLVRAVEQLRDLPEVQAALESGRVTLPQARAIASKVHTLPRVPQFRTAVAARMLELVDAHGHDASDLQTVFGDVVRELDPDAALVNAEKERAKAERAAHHARHLSFAEDGHGGVRVKIGRAHV